MSNWLCSPRQFFFFFWWVLRQNSMCIYEDSSKDFKPQSGRRTITQDTQRAHIAPLSPSLSLYYQMSLSSIALDMSSKWYQSPAQRWRIYVFAGLATLASPYVIDYLLIFTSAALPNIFCSFCIFVKSELSDLIYHFIGCCSRYLFKTAHRILHSSHLVLFFHLFPSNPNSATIKEYWYYHSLDILLFYWQKN